MEDLPGAELATMIHNMREDFDEITDDIGSHTAEENIEKLAELGALHCFTIADQFKVYAEDMEKNPVKE